jgi:hypothetical protein
MTVNAEAGPRARSLRVQISDRHTLASPTRKRYALHRLWFRPDLSRPSAAAGLESARGTEGPLYPADGLYLVLGGG